MSLRFFYVSRLIDIILYISDLCVQLESAQRIYSLRLIFVQNVLFESASDIYTDIG